MSVFPGWRKYSITPVIPVRALHHSVITLILMNLLAATLRPNPTAVFRPAALHLLFGIQFRLRRIREKLIVRLMAVVVALLLVNVFPPPRHAHHAAVSPELALHQFFGIAAVIVIADRHGRECVADGVHAFELVPVVAKLLVNVTSPRHHSYPAAYQGIRTLHQIIVTVSEIGRHVLLLQVRPKLASRIIILTLIITLNTQLSAINKQINDKNCLATVQYRRAYFLIILK